MEKYPDELLRGVVNRDMLNSEGTASVSLFKFEINPDRNDAHQTEEMSINWCDDRDKAMSIAMNQTNRDGTLQFKAGVAFLSKYTLDIIKKSRAC